MIKGKTNKSTFGNFAYVLTFELLDEQALAACAAGIVQVAQRKPASDAEKLLAGYEKRPEKFERASIPYSAANAEVLRKAFEGIAGVTGVEITEHVPGESTESKFAFEKEVLAERESGDSWELWLSDTLKFTGETHGEDGEYSLPLLVAVRERKRKAMEELKKGI